VFGLIVIGALGIYLIVLIAVTWFAYHCAAKNGAPLGKRLLAAAGGFLLVYLPVFWDHIPTIMAHNYYCEKEAGFWVYKTVEQWKAENPGVIEKQISNRGQIRKSVGDRDNFTDSSFLNERFVFLAKHNGPLFLNRWRREQEIVDRMTGEVLARRVEFSTSQERRQAGWSGWKIWLDAEQCSRYAHKDSGSISAILDQVEGKK
jgi:hypothetical protein